MRNPSTWWQRARDGSWRRWSHRKADWEPAPGPPPAGDPVTGLLAQQPSDPPPPPRLLTRNQFVLWCVLVAGAILFGSMVVLWVLAPVWDPLDIRGRGVWRGYRRALPWIALLTAAGQAVYAILGRKRSAGEGRPPGEAATPVAGTAREATVGGEPERRTPAEWLADPPAPPPEDLQLPGEWFRGLARFLAVACAVLAVGTGLIGFACATQQPSEILGTDPQGAARWSVWMAGGFALAAVFLWWLGRERR